MLHGPCPVCNSPYTAFVREVATVRTHRNLKLFSCLDCLSFWNPSDYVETDDILLSDIRWGLSVESRNQAAGRELFASLKARGVDFSNVVEIGCGIGTMTALVSEFGGVAVGFDVNSAATAHGRSVGRETREEIWTADTDVGTPTLFLNISVLEHIDRPRPLIAEMCAAARRADAALYISVPFVDRDRWHYLTEANPADAHTPFFDNDVHVVHFSTDGLSRALQEFGAIDPTPISAGIWKGLVVQAWRPCSAA